MSVVVPLDAADADLALVGGKGASLARLAGAGLPVPPGFDVTTVAYRDFAATAGLQERILAAVAEVDPDRPETAQAASGKIQQWFAESPVPEEIAEAIRAAYAGMGEDVPVAVRSSATAEDLPEMSFAGQQDTYLNIRGETAVLDAVRRCWASLWTARAIDYRLRNGVAADEVALAVVVQELVPAEAAGVLFTRDPVTGAGEDVLVNAAWGLGEAIVGGQVTPDTYVVARDGQVREQVVGDKAVMTVRTAEGTREEPVPEGRRGVPVLSPAEAGELAALGVRIEELYRCPMDVEWAARDGRFWVVQARPITGLRDRPVETWNDSLGGDYLWTCANLGEAIPSVMTPCTWSLVEIFMSETMALSRVGPHRLSGNIGGRFYLNLSLTFAVGNALGLGSLVRAASEQAFGRIPADVAVPALPMSRWRVVRSALASGLPFLRRVAAYQRRLPELLAASPDRCARLHERIAAVGDAGELRALWRSDVEPLLRDSSRMLAAGARLDGAGLVRIRPRLLKLVGEADANALLTGLSAGGDALASLGPVMGLGELARGEIGRETFARSWGHRCPDEFEVSAPRPAEDPEWIDRQLAGLRSAADPAELLARQQRARDAAWARLRSRHPGKERGLRRRIAGAARAARGREAARSELIRAFWVLRAFVLRAGELTGCGEDLFFLRIEEVLAVLGGSREPLGAVADRRQTYRAYAALGPYPTLVRGHFDPVRWSTLPDRRMDVFDESVTLAPVSHSVRGFAGAAGVVEGTARVLTSVDEGDSLRPGEVLVTTVTNVGWTPLFPRAAAVVTDVGAPLSHAAIVARELGIPAVVGCGNATTRLRSGDRVRVDGAAGTVEVLTADSGVEE
ncbi:PEP/pyruvate-binding domain-containing protein [Saccharopolyspora shandongensis]|uniref:PEP/pyruvate-binding domain-containing protein n=1 Tax=Saccharopolyspora shandongensis TaxID=418495 RepID=UPI001FE64B27|nr:PEP/pyruvate-binding domain-containing protein [Saccharopolyspora shandongensis]